MSPLFHGIFAGSKNQSEYVINIKKRINYDKNKIQKQR